MLNIGLGEVGVVAVVALLVLGPKQILVIARTAGRWWGRWRRAVESINKEVESINKDDSVKPKE